MKRLIVCAVCVFGFFSLSAQAQRIDPSKNLVFNPTFSMTNAPLHGWNYDYQWTKISHYMNNHKRVSQVKSYKGRRNVMFINGNAGETKAESKPIKMEKGARYRCTLDYTGTTTPHMYFTGYQWKPGVRPYDDPHLGDLRRRYKSQFRGVKTSAAPGGWKRATFEFPLPDDKLSRLAKSHLKHLRFFTVYIIVIADASGQIYVDDVKVTRIK